MVLVKSGLGRGLSSLIPKKINRDILPKDSPVAIDDNSQVLQVPTEKINPNPEQPRRDFSPDAMNELIESIKQYGIVQPLIATKTDQGYQLISGERRLRAAKTLKLAAVPVIIREAERQAQLELALIENIQRQNLNPIEEAVAYQRLMDEFNITQDEAAKRVGKSRPVVANMLRLLTLPDKIQKALVDGRINYSAARAIIGLPPSEQLVFFDSMIKNQLPVRNIENDARKVSVRKHQRTVKDPNIFAKEERLRQALGTKVIIKKSSHGGQIVIEFYSDEELAGLCKKISG